MLINETKEQDVLKIFLRGGKDGKIPLRFNASFGGRGLRQVQSSYESCIIAIRQHLIKDLHRNSVLEYIYEKETNDILRIGQKLLQKYNILSNPNEPPKSVSRKFTKADQTWKREHL